MRKLFIYIFIMFSFIIFTNKVYADNCDGIDFSNQVCNFSVGTSSCKNTSLKPLKVYEHDYLLKDQKVKIHGLCYYSSAKKGYFYTAYHDNGKKCYQEYKAFTPNNSKNPGILIKKNSDRLFITVPSSLDENSGCAPYFYVSLDSNNLQNVNFAYSNPGTYNWVDETNLGEVTVDNETLGKMKTCLEKKFLSESFCSNSSSDAASTYASECIKQNSTGFSNDLFEKVKSELVTYIKQGNTISNAALFCHLKQKCSGLNSQDFIKYVVLKEKNPSKSDRALFEEAIPNNSSLVSCLADNSNTEEAKKKEEELKDQVSDAVSSELDNQQSTLNNFRTTGRGTAPNVPNLDFNQNNDCASILGTNLTKVVKGSIKVLQILGAIIAIVNGMIKLIPAIMSKDADGLKKASKDLVMMAIILAIIFLFPTVLNLIGKIFKFDVSCIV